MDQILTFFGYVGIGLGLILSGVLNSGDRMRVNYSSETLSEKAKRFNIALILILIGLISFGLKYLFFV